MTPILHIQVLPHGEGLPLPEYQTAAAAGMDICAALNAPDQITIAPGARALIPTGLMLAIPEGYEGQVRPRSGMAAKQGVTVLNAPGTIDADYRGEVKVILVNLGQEPALIKRGDRIAQLILSPVARLPQKTVKSLPDTERGTGGFGSTGS